MHPSFPLCLKSELDHFSVSPPQTAIESAKYVTYSLVGDNLKTTPGTWEVPSTPDEVTDLAQIS